MKISVENDGNFLPEDIRNQVISVIDNSLQGITTNGKIFEVNDQLCYREQRTGKITTCVMNSATYISSKFQYNLAQIPNCKGETKIGDQAIDGFCRFRFSGKGYRIKDKEKLLEVIYAYIKANTLPASSIYTLFPMFQGMFVDNRQLYSIDAIPSDYHHLFVHENIENEFRIGVEFETGNVASSFRAINKLFILFQQGEIDAGVFVTCVDKPNAATRIWPVSNRNGSFQELKMRNYAEQVSLPLICIGFAPDSFSKDAQFLGKNGETFELTETGKMHSNGNYTILLGEDGEEILCPA